MDRRVWVGLVIVLIICIVGFVWMSGDREETTGVPEDTVSEAPKESSKPNRVLPKPKTLSTAAARSAEDVQEEQESPEDDYEEDVESPKDPVSAKKMLGAMSRSSIDDGILDVMPDIRGCYQDALKEVPDLEGRIVVKFTIKGENGVGRVIKTSIKDVDFDDVPLEDCIMDVVESVDFEPPQGGGIVIVSYPFIFAPG